MGTFAANQQVGDIVEVKDVPTVLTVGLFDGIGGVRVAADAVGLRVTGHVSVECHGPARRAVESRFPGTVFVECVEDVTSDSVKAWACQYTHRCLWWSKI